MNEPQDDTWIPLQGGAKTLYRGPNDAVSFAGLSDTSYVVPYPADVTGFNSFLPEQQVKLRAWEDATRVGLRAEAQKLLGPAVYDRLFGTAAQANNALAEVRQAISKGNSRAGLNNTSSSRRRGKANCRMVQSR